MSLLNWYSIKDIDCHDKLWDNSKYLSSKNEWSSRNWFPDRKRSLTGKIRHISQIRKNREPKQPPTNIQHPTLLNFHSEKHDNQRKNRNINIHNTIPPISPIIKQNPSNNTSNKPTYIRSNEYNTNLNWLKSIYL